MTRKIKAMSEHRPSDDFLLIREPMPPECILLPMPSLEASSTVRRTDVFLEGLRTERSSRNTPKRVQDCCWPTAELAKPADLSREFESLGYDRIYPLSMMRLAMGHVARGLAHLQEHGSVEGLMDEMQTRTELYGLGYQLRSPWWFPSSPD